MSRPEYLPTYRPGYNGKYDVPIDKPPRPCACCGKAFQPTIRRRLLCEWCFLYGDGGLDEDEE